MKNENERKERKEVLWIVEASVSSMNVFLQLPRGVIDKLFFALLLSVSLSTPKNLKTLFSGCCFWNAPKLSQEKKHTTGKEGRETKEKVKESKRKIEKEKKFVFLTSLAL